MQTAREDGKQLGFLVSAPCRLDNIMTAGRKMHLAESDEAFGGGQILVLDPHAHVLGGQPEEAANG